MNLFFGVKGSIVNSKLTVPRFQNSKTSNNDYMLFQLEISNKKWKINKLIDVELTRDFYKINTKYINNGNNFFLATQNEIQEFNKTNYSKLLNLNNFTDTNPSFRANLQVSTKSGGFSSYQSEYPFSMTTKKGSILSPISSLLNKNSDKNIFFLKNIYELPIQEEFNVFFVNLKTKKVLKKVLVLTNYMNEIFVDKELIKPEVFLFTDKYLAVPIFCSILKGHISFEHTHPPHEYIISEDKFKVVSELKKEINEIIN